ncbi:MAG: phosphotransferase, partial [Pseudomonadales bacterium]|nr:phosphotransferase [Pseudomonadales bacterium]
MLDNLYEWVASRPSLETLQGTRLELEPLGGDAGFRRYFRVQNSRRSLLAVISPPETEKNREFVTISSLLRRNGLLAPEVLDADFERGFLLVEDVGSQQLLGLLTPETVDRYYHQAFRDLLSMQRINRRETGLPCYSSSLLKQEMALFPEWFVGKLLGLELETDELKLIEDLFGVLSVSAESQPQVFVHRDFHSRNLMVNEGARLGIIDFQDAVNGPLTYDLVSLLRDCYVYWPDQSVEKWLEEFYQSSLQQGYINPGSKQEFVRWFDLMGLQRHIKVLGIFARLSLRDQKHGYLDDLPLVIHYVKTVAAKYPELFAGFTAFFDSRLMPVIASKD